MGVIVGLFHNIYDSAKRYELLGYEDKKHHHKYLCKIVPTDLLLELQSNFMNYDPVLRSYSCV